MQQWATAIRLLLERERLLDNYNRVLAKMQTGIGKECLYAQIRREQVRRGVRVRSRCWGQKEVLSNLAEEHQGMVQVNQKD